MCSFSSGILFFVSLLVVIILMSGTHIKEMYQINREVKWIPLVMHVQFLHISSFSVLTGDYKVSKVSYN